MSSTKSYHWSVFKPPILPTEHVNFTPANQRKIRRKSRLGCGNCKRRRIKCDERKPQCTNCAGRSVSCDFLASGESTALEGASLLRSPPSHGELNTVDLELLLHYTTRTSYSITSALELHPTLQVTYPEIALSHHFVMHGILALSALHLASINKIRRAHYQAQADRHFAKALRMAQAFIPTLDDTNCHAFPVFTDMCFFVSLARGPKKGEFLFFNDDGGGEWFALFRGKNSIYQTRRDALLKGPLGPDLQATIQYHETSTGPKAADAEPFGELRLRLETTFANDPDLQVYTEALEAILQCFRSRPGDHDPKRKAAPYILTGAWLYQLSEEFLVCLKQRKPAALAIYAHYVVLVRDLRSMWLIDGWADHLISGTYHALPLEFRHWIQWPMQQLGWIPD
ncbi:hypothetical protein AJ80_00409 [Polytolypa hystricis UAMH7299]|uniref:Zn(2)-C6 fungal-type domain-containing protein n=1 Tax=Polytolypa hystricis (strain UAMH7299) TaxID=1447883 RepID=A0A2B7Z3N7_POLH7|nr:hypothetical protein AJ80_00409 [Polytolypa hystricis UAMH7299]